ncbi:MAG: trypsin-like peptidase domain-containing protein [Nitrospirota bacterium]|nr:trypsin-like peptidase domain-containing protein [Nitrospirota bacterium]
MTYFTGLAHRRHWCAALLLLVFLAPWPAEAAATPEVEEAQTVRVYKEIVRATVFLSSSYVAGPGTNTTVGTGFILDETGTVVTNAHVVSGAHHVTATLYDGQRVKVEVIGIDHYTDVAVLQLKGFAGKLPTVRLGSSETLQIGQRTFVIGNPYGLGFGLSTGILSGINRTPPTLDLMAPSVPLLQTTAPINPGDSGGPLVNSEGHVIGVTTALLAGTQNIGFAIPINLVKEVVTELKTTGRVQRPWIGVAGKFITDDIRELFVLPLTDGMLVETVAPDSPASHAGLRAGTVDVVVSGQPWMMGGDIIVAINGTPVHAVRDFLIVLKTLRIGETIDMEFLRDRARQTLSVIVSERPQESSAPSGRSAEVRFPAQPSPGRLGRPSFRGGQVEGTRPSVDSTDGRDAR